MNLPRWIEMNSLIEHDLLTARAIKSAGLKQSRQHLPADVPWNNDNRNNPGVSSGPHRSPTPSFPSPGLPGRGGRWMRNPGGKGFFRGHPASFRKGRRNRRPAAKPRLKPACSREEPPPWSPKESPSPPGPALRAKLGVGPFDIPLALRVFLF